MLSKREHLLVCLMEECNEVAQAASKCIRFGDADSYLPTDPTNLTQVTKEFNELLAVVKMLNEIGVIIPMVRHLQEEKIERLATFMQYSRQRKTLEENSPYEDCNF